MHQHIRNSRLHTVKRLEELQAVGRELPAL